MCIEFGYKGVKNSLQADVLLLNAIHEFLLAIWKGVSIEKHTSDFGYRKSYLRLW